MRNVIIEKLRRQLVDPVDAECKVVYVLCEIRKVLEKDPPGLFALRMHCHWALHVDLTRPNTRRTFLDRVDEVVFNMLTPGVPSTGYTLAAENALYYEFGFLNLVQERIGAIPQCQRIAD